MSKIQNFIKLSVGSLFGLLAFPVLADIPCDGCGHWRLPGPPQDPSVVLISLGISTTFYFIATIILELPIMYWFGFRSRQKIIAVVIANLVSVPVLHIATKLFYASMPLMEGLVILIEFFILGWLVKDIRWRKMLTAVIVVNLFSAIFGTITLAYLGIF